jgi:hypothetical protein
MQMEGKRRSLGRFLFMAIFLLGTVLGSNEVSYAITNGQPDGNSHPFVGAAHNGEVFCSGSAISPDIFVTAAHCFNYSGEKVWVTFDPEPFAPGNKAKYYTGTWYPHPDFCLECAPGLPGTDTNDVAVVVLDRPVFQEEYAQLPAEGLVDTLAMGTEVTIVGYGAQFYVPGGGPRQPVYLRTRYYAPTLLVASEHGISDEYIKLTANPAQGKGGICFGDSGGPDLLEMGGLAIILAINSFGTNYNCTGINYSNRIDTADVLEFIRQFLSKR